MLHTPYSGSQGVQGQMFCNMIATNPYSQSVLLLSHQTLQVISESPAAIDASVNPFPHRIV